MLNIAHASVTKIIKIHIFFTIFFPGCKLRQQTVAFAELNDRGAVVIGREAEPNGRFIVV